MLKHIFLKMTLRYITVFFLFAFNILLILYRRFWKELSNQSNKKCLIKNECEKKEIKRSKVFSLIPECEKFNFIERMSVTLTTFADFTESLIHLSTFLLGDKRMWQNVHSEYFILRFQSFTWNLGRPVDEAEVLQLAIVSRGVLRNEKVAARYGLVLQTVVREGRILVSDSLVDLNNKPLPVRSNIEENSWIFNRRYTLHSYAIHR